MHEGLRDISHDSAILAIGCGEAFLAPQLAEYAAAVTVLDSSGVEMGQLARRFPEISFLQHHPATPLPFADATFDAIWCCDVLDRVFDPATVLRELRRVLKPGGRLLATVPAQGAVRQVLRVLFRPAGTNPHVRDFTPRSLAKLAREEGFQSIHVKSAGGRLLRAGEPRRLLLQAKKGFVAPVVRLARRVRPVAAGRAEVEETSWVGRCRAA